MRRHVFVLLVLMGLGGEAFALGEDGNLKGEGHADGRQMLLSGDEYLKIRKLKATKQLSYADAEKMLQDKKTVLLDVRGDADFKQLHIRGAKHLSYADMTFERLGKLLPEKHQRIILYCDVAIKSLLTRMAPLSGRAFEDMTRQGYDNLYEIRALPGNSFKAVCQDALNTPFEGDPKAIDDIKQEALRCLSKY